MGGPRVHHRLGPVAGPNIIGAALAFAIVVFVLRDRERRVLRELTLPTLLAVALTLIDLQWGAVVFGLLIVLPQLVGQGAQLRALLTTATRRASRQASSASSGSVRASGSSTGSVTETGP